MAPRVKAFAGVVKAAGEPDGLDAGEFTAFVSVFGNVDSMGDRVLRGAFADDLAAWKAGGDPIPVVWSHDWRDPFSHIGEVREASESDRGLMVRGALDLDNPKAAQVFRLLKGRRVRQFSFAYDVIEERPGEDGANELAKLHVHEVGPTLVGANQETELLAVKAGLLAPDTDPAVIDAAIAALTQARTRLGKAQSEPAGDGQPGTDDDPPAAGKSERPARRVSRARLLAEIARTYTDL